ncbi:YigZ family protein [Allonocardiopsis opalescens]|uniref:Putative YigZ family protein n=1 Tax=Allonocardiopsis opalescens TaxID=1144618 RepID=A0A2T0Q505_9ACTN|nr:YigZ family protein [Allonocardiopsis opalescens]PRX98884.1 putative YigZ family protein [Allonocardiopsis opalescens]
MRTIGRDGEHELEIRRSRFLCALRRVRTEEEARAFIAERRRLHGTATHNCTAYVLGADGGVQRSNDDGEPSGTAGMPMLEVLRRRELTEVAAVVTRYFGGVKLGAGGLVRAYGGAVSAALDKVGLLELRRVLLVAVTADYADAGRLESTLRASRFEVVDTDYGGAGLTVAAAVAEPELDAFASWLAESVGGRARWAVTGSAVRERPAEEDGRLSPG